MLPSWVSEKFNANRIVCHDLATPVPQIQTTFSVLVFAEASSGIVSFRPGK